MLIIIKEKSPKESLILDWMLCRLLITCCRWWIPTLGATQAPLPRRFLQATPPSSSSIPSSLSSPLSGLRSFLLWNGLAREGKERQIHQATECWWFSLCKICSASFLSQFSGFLAIDLQPSCNFLMYFLHYFIWFSFPCMKSRFMVPHDLLLKG